MKQGGKSVNDYMLEAKEKGDHMVGASEPVVDKNLIYQILNCLREDFSNLVTSILLRTEWSSLEKNHSLALL